MADTTYVERFRAASPGQQLSLVAAIGAMLAVLIGLAWYFLIRTPYEPLFNDMRTADAATIVAELDRQQIPYRLADGGSTILVPAMRVDATRLSVMSEDLPLKGAVGFELFNKSDMGLTDFAQKINYQRALQGELARTIMTLDGVESVRVHLSLGEDRIFRDDRVPPKASVTVHMKSGAALPESAATGIQRLVAAAVPQLDAANVVILDEEGSVVGVQQQPLFSGAPITPLAQEKLAIEQHYAAVVRAALGKRYRGQPIDVAVTAHLPQAEGAGLDLPKWTSAGRDFRLDVTVDAPSGLSTDDQARMLATVGGAIGVNPALGDAIAFGPITQARPASRPDWVPYETRRPQTAEGSGHAVDPGMRTWFTVAGIVALVLLALAVVGVVMRNFRRRTELSSAERVAFAARLRDALDHGEGARHAS